MDDIYTVKGYWSIEGIFNGAVYRNNRKFAFCCRVQMNMIAVRPSLGKDIPYRQFKKWLIENRLKRFDFLTDQIQIYTDNHPEKKLKLI